MKTEETTTSLPLETLLSIRAVSGGERGKEGSGTKNDYMIGKGTFLALISQVFDKEVEASKPENEKSGGAISQFLHSYGATAAKMEKSGVDPFPETGNEFTTDNVEAWLEVLEFKKPREAGSRKTAEEVTIEAILTTLTVPGVTWAMLAPVYPSITQEKIDAYKAKVAAKQEG